MDLQPPTDAAFTATPSPFERACERCGNYAPLSSKYGPELCADCIERTAHPIVQSGSTVPELLRGVWQLLPSVGWQGALIVTLAGLPLSLVEHFLPELPFVVSNFWSFFVGTAAEMVVLHLAWQAITHRGARVDVGAAVQAVGQRYGGLLGTRFISNLVILLFSLLLIVPGVIKALSLTVAMPITLHEGSDASTAMSQSTARMEGHRVSAFLAFLALSAPFLVLLGAIACVSFTQAFALTAAGGDPAAAEAAPFYRYAMLAIAIVTPAFLVPVSLLPAVLYAKLPQPEFRF